MSSPHGGLPAPISALEFGEDPQIGFPTLKRVPRFSRAWWSYRVFWKLHFVNRVSLHTIVMGKLGRWLRRLGWIAPHKTFTHIDLSETARRWRDDDFFAVQHTAHHNPEMIEACRALPDDVGARVTGQLPDLAGRLREGEVFVVDHQPTIGPFIDQVRPGRVMKASRAWFLRTPDSGRGSSFQPIAIEAAGTVTLPDQGERWQLARWNHQQCNFLNAQIRYHLLLNHTVVEVFALSMYRRLEAGHALRTVLMPFVGSVPFVNNGFGKELIYGHLVRHYALSLEGVLGFSRASLVGRAHAYFDFREDLERRGMRGQSGYAFGRVGEAWLDSQDQHLAAILEAMYPTEEAFQADVSARHWATEAIGQLGWVQTFPMQEWSRSMLMKLLSGIVMSSSFRHSIYHFKCHELLGLKENAPFHLRAGGALPTMDEQQERQMVGCGLEYPNVLYDLGRWSPGHDSSLHPELSAAVERLYVDFHRMTATLKAAEPDFASLRVTTMSH